MSPAAASMPSSRSVPPGSVLVGADGSSPSQSAVDWAADQAALEHRPLTLVCATGSVTDLALGRLEDGEIQRVMDRMAAGGREVVTAAAARVAARHPALDVHPVTVPGDPRIALLDLAGRANLLVVGSRGLGPVGRLLVGSVSLHRSRHADCPVVVVRTRHPGRVRRGVVVGADATAASLPVLETAYRLASFRGLPLTVLHCAWELVSSAVGAHVVPTSSEGLDEVRLALSESTAGLAEKFSDVPVTVELVRGLPSDAVLAAAARADVVVVGRHAHGHGLAHLMFGDVATRVVERADSVVVVVPEG